MKQYWMDVLTVANLKKKGLTSFLGFNLTGIFLLQF